MSASVLTLYLAAQLGGGALPLMVAVPMERCAAVARTVLAAHPHVYAGASCRDPARDGVTLIAPRADRIAPRTTRTAEETSR